MSAITGRIVLWAVTSLAAALGLQGDARTEPREVPTEPSAAGPIAASQGQTLFDFEANAITGEAKALAQYRGRVVLVVNTASRCGLTPQYAALERVYQMHKERGFVVLGFPSNSFGQELATNEAVAQFCEVNFGLTFPLFEITEVRGETASPVFQFLKQHVPENRQPDWNFAKYLVNRQGKPVRFFSARISPEADELLAAIRAELERKPD